MFTDYNPVSTKDHDLNYFLKTWGKKRTKKNRVLLHKKIEEFKAISTYSPHNRESFLTYVKNRRIKSLFDTLKPVKKKKSLLQGKIRKKAYDLYVLRVKDAIPGDPFTDWLLAEKVVKKEIKKKAACMEKIL